MIGLALALNAALPRGVVGPIDNGMELVDNANTTVTPTGGDGFQVERTTGGGAWDASAVSTESIEGDSEVVIHWQAGSFFAGLSHAADPTLSNSFDFAGYSIWFISGTDITVNGPGGGQLGAGRPFKPYGKVEYIAATDTINFYTSNDGVAWGAAIESVTPTGGAVYWFDSSLNDAGAKFTAKLTGAA